VQSQEGGNQQANPAQSTNSVSAGRQRRWSKHAAMIRCLQINLQRSSIPQSLLQQTSAATGAQILIVSEQNWNPTHDDRWVASTDGTCAVALMATADFVPDSIGAGRGFAWIQSRDIRIYSCYISRNDTDANFANFLGDVEQFVH